MATCFCTGACRDPNRTCPAGLPSFVPESAWEPPKLSVKPDIEKGDRVWIRKPSGSIGEFWVREVKNKVFSVVNKESQVNSRKNTAPITWYAFANVDILEVEKR